EAKVENHLYSEQEKRFLADRYVVGTCPKCGYEGARGDECQKCAASYEATDLKSPRSKLTGAPLTLKPSEHLYLRFDRFQSALAEWLKTKDWKENVVRFAMGYVDHLKPRAITRDSDWGIPVPGYPGKVFYVWFDAPIGYISATQEWAESIGRPEAWKEYWLDPDARLVQFIGKDNIPFHAVFFPAMLMGQTIPYKLPDEIPANEFLLLEGRQFSKSDNWTIDLDPFLTQFSADQARYALAANAPETSDAEFSWRDFQARCNGELLGKLANFVHRTLTFATTHTSAQIPPLHELDAADQAFRRACEETLSTIETSFASFHVRKATQELILLAQHGNVYFDLKKPWLLAKDPAQKIKLETTIHLCIECIQLIALAASPVMPETAEKIWHMLSADGKRTWDETREHKLPPGQPIRAPEHLFRKIEDKEMEEQIAKLGDKPAPVEMSVATHAPLKSQIQFDQFGAVDLRVAQVVHAEKVPKSKKLLKLTLDLGFEKRTVVSGIALRYEPEALLGKKIILVANLAPATIMGIESQGMVLAGHSGALLELPELPNLAPGSVVS
ncbi:MAG: Methionyl-tRNA synthetase, partial [Chlamydiota bacterium]